MRVPTVARVAVPSRIPAWVSRWVTPRASSPTRPSARPTSAARSEHHAELEPLLVEAFLRRSTERWVEVLRSYGIPCGPLNTIPEVTRMPQVQAREMLVPTEHHTLGTVPLVNTPVKLSRTPGGIRGSSPDMGQHTRAVLDELLGVDDATVDDLLARDIVQDRRVAPELG